MNDYTQPNSPIARVLSGRYTLIVRYDREGGVVESIATGQQWMVLGSEVADTLMYRCVQPIQHGNGGVRYATERGRKAFNARN